MDKLIAEIGTSEQTLPPGIDELIAEIEAECKEMRILYDIVPGASDSADPNKLIKVTTRLTELKSEIKNLQDELTARRDENEKLKDKLEKMNKKEVENAREIEHLKDTIRECEFEISELQNFMREKKEEFEDYHRREKLESTVLLLRIVEEKEELQKDSRTLQQEKDELKKEKNQLQCDRNTLQNEQDKFKQEKEELQHERATLHEEVKNQKEELQRERATLYEEVKNQKKELQRERATLHKKVKQKKKRA